MQKKTKTSDTQQLQTISKQKNRSSDQTAIINGFTRQKTVHQFIIICLPFIAFVLSLLILFFAKQTTSFKTTFAIVYALIFIFMAVAWFKVSSIDPTDTIHQYSLQFKKKHKFFDKSKYSTCTKCMHLVEDHSFHCQECNRCVPMLSHHSKWVNNCIGAKNYFQFIWMLLFLGLLSGLQLGVTLYLQVRMAQLQRPSPCQISISVFCLILNLLVVAPSLFFFIQHIISIYKHSGDIDLICQYRKSSRIKPQMTYKSLHMNFFTAREQSPTPEFFIKKVTSQHFNSQTDSQKQEQFPSELPVLPALLKKKLITLEKYEFIKKYGHLVSQIGVRQSSEVEERTLSIEEKAIIEKIAEQKQQQI